MALKPYERKETIDPRARQVDYSAPGIADAGQAIRGLSRSLLDLAEPKLKERATDIGTNDAATAPLMRDAAGNVVRAEPLPGGGQVYRMAFKEAAGSLYKGRLMADYDVAIGNIVAENPDDPQKAWALMQAHTEAVAKTVPPEMLPDIEPIMLREATQQFNGLNYSKIKRDHTNLIEGHERLYHEKRESYINARSLALRNQDFALVAQLDKDFDAFQVESQAARTALNELTPEGQAAEKETVDSRRLTMSYEETSIRSIRSITEKTNELIASPGELQLMVKWATGPISTSPDEKVLGMTYDDYIKFLATPEAVADMARFAQGLIGDIDKAKADEAARLQAEKDASKDQATQLRQDALGVFAVGSDKDARDDWNEMIDRVIVGNGGNISNFMNAPEGRAFMRKQVAENGQLPVTLKAWLDGSATGANVHLAAEFVANMLDDHDSKVGYATGVAAFKQIDPTARGYIQRYMEWSDAGIPTALRRQMIEDVIHGTFEKHNIAAAFDKQDQKNGQKLYVEERGRMSLAMFGVAYEALPVDMQAMIDRDSKGFLSAYGQDPKAAVRAAIESTATLWTPSTKGVQGYIPTELAGLNLTDTQMDYAFGNLVAGKGHVYGGAGFTTFTDANSGHLPRARIAFNDETQLMRGLGNYTVYYYDRQGNLIGSPRHVNIDQVMAAHFGGLLKLEEQTKLARRDMFKKRRAEFQQKLNRATMSEPILKPRRGRDY